MQIIWLKLKLFAKLMLMIAFVLGWLGLAFGSFINALVWRLRHKKDWVKGRSECTHCHHTLQVKDLIPILSWLWLRGKCRYCNKKIEDSPLVELFTAGAFALSYLAWAEGFEGLGLLRFVLWLPLLVILIALAVYDIRYMELPDRLTGAAAVTVIGHLLIRLVIFDGRIDALTSAVLGFLTFGGLFYVLFQISSGRWIGGGDVKLGFVMGVWLGGILPNLLVIFIASLLGTAIAILLLITGRASLKTKIPFGPLLIIAIFTVQLYGERLVDFYKSTFLLI